MESAVTENYISVAALREKGWLDVRTDTMHWSNLTRSYGVDEFQLVNDWDELVYPDDCEVVIFDESAEVVVTDFQHPRNAIYLFGRSTINRIQDRVSHDHAVRIPTPFLKDMFGTEAAAIALYTRWLQWP